jgi:hypothetical protein
MNVLYIVGTNLKKNTSANISHNAYVQGLLECGCNVDIVMALSSWGQDDSSLPEWEKANYYTYESVSCLDKLRNKFKKYFDAQVIQKESSFINLSLQKNIPKFDNSWKQRVRHILKTIYVGLFHTTHLYPLEQTWLKKASRFKRSINYDVIISNSSPAASHKLVFDLLSKKRIIGKRWIQIWEDPWYYDLYGSHNEKIRQEEHRLLKAAQEIFYVSPLTLNYQKIHFMDCANKMKHIPLPFLKISENKSDNSKEILEFGYFGDYFSKTRNLNPFYEALIECKTHGYILGDSDLSLKSTKTVQVGGRVTIDKLIQFQDKSDVLVHLCNLQGGQIPGKIYHYSATTKPILFILDGTPEEITMIREYFEKYNRYNFCYNRKDDIVKTIRFFNAGNVDMKKQPVFEFQPKQVVSILLNS